MQLRYTPKDELQVQTLSGAVLNTTFQIGEVIDARAVGPSEIGENIEDQPVPVRTSAESVVATVREAFLRSFAEAGLRVSQAAPVFLKVQIVKLWVSEDNMYNATARLRVDVLREGKPSGSVLVEGMAKQFGSSLKGENYREVLSDAILEAIGKLLGDQGFGNAVAGQVAATEGEGPKTPSAPAEPVSPSEGEAQAQ